MNAPATFAPILFISVLIVCGAATSTAMAQERTARREVGSSAPRHTEIVGSSVLPMEPGFQWAVVEVRINDQGPFRMILDSGAGVTVLNEDLVLELGLESRGTTRLGDPSSPQAHAADILELDTVSLGDAYFEGVSAVGWRGTSLASMGGIRGILGFPTFAECLLTFDFPARTVEIEAGALPEPDGKEIFPMKLNGSPSIPIEVAGFELEAHIDTGNAGTLVVPEAWLDRIPIVAGTARPHTSQRAGTPAEATVAQIVGNVTIGDFVVETPTVHFDKTLPVVNIGQGLLKEFRLTFDQRAGRLALTRPTPAPAKARAGISQEKDTPRAAPRRAGMQLAMKNGSQFLVGDVFPGSAAEQAGIQKGDAMLEVDGEPMTQDVMFTALRGTQPVVLTIEREGKRLTKTLFEN